MGWLTPKYPPGAEPASTPKRQSRSQRHAAEVSAAKERHSTIGETDIRAMERAGWRVDRRSRHVVAERTTSSGGTEVKSFTVLGNGRYGKR